MHNPTDHMHEWANMTLAEMNAPCIDTAPDGPHCLLTLSQNDGLQPQDGIVIEALGALYDIIIEGEPPSGSTESELLMVLAPRLIANSNPTHNIPTCLIGKYDQDAFFSNVVHHPD